VSFTKDELLAWLEKKTLGDDGAIYREDEDPFAALRLLIERSEKVDALVERANDIDEVYFNVAESAIRRHLLVKEARPTSKMYLALDNIIGLLQDLAALRKPEEEG
jgi:hypothetical protein